MATIAQGVDITERKQAAEALRLKELVEHCFAAMLAHDLKSPLIGTMRLIDLFLDGNLGTLTPEQNAFLSLVRGSTRSLLSMVENLLDLYRIEAGAYQPRLETVDIGALVRSCCLGIAPLAACRNICLDIDMMPGLEPLEADGMSMQRVLYNLLDNAQKFSPEGGSILVAVRKSSDKIIIDISDDGPGILKEELDKLFERCLRDRAELSFKTGVGLGLYLCRHLVGAHGGELTYQAREGGGSVFTVVLPARPAKAIESSPVGSRESIDIMLVEDNAITRVCVRLMLEQTGEFNVIAEAADGESACKKVCEFKPALVLLDIGLPDISGIEVCKRIKSECPETRVLMLTSYEDGSVLLASLGAGADGYCIKGISTEDLIKAVRVVHSGTTWLDPRIKVGITTNS